MEQCLYNILYFDVIMILITLMKLGMVFKMYLNEIYVNIKILKIVM